MHTSHSTNKNHQSHVIPRQLFGRTGHTSTRVIFGAYALNKATPAEADAVLDTLLEYGVNHIDTAPMYGNAEKRIGPWMEGHRDAFFIATKTRSRTYQGAWDNLQRSLERLRVDHVDLWQMHGLTNPAGWEKAMGPGGALQALVEARDQGLVRYLGVTGHGLKTPAMHLRSLRRFDFDAVMLPFNYPLMQIPQYAADLTVLLTLCRERRVAVQTIKSIARRPWAGRDKTYNTYFYEPLVAQEAIDQAVHWVLGYPDVFLITAGDMQLLPNVLQAARGFQARPTEVEMEASVARFAIQALFT